MPKKKHITDGELNAALHDALLHEILDQLGAPKEHNGGILSAYGRLRRLAPVLQAAKEDAALLDCWQNGPGFLVGVTADARWQAACQEPGLVGKGLVGPTLREVLRQVRDVQSPPKN